MDKRTLELAAKAAGFDPRITESGIIKDGEWTPCWQPHINKAQFYNLAEAIGATIKFRDGIVTADFNCVRLWEGASSHGGDIQKALVALAARIGESMT